MKNIRKLMKTYCLLCFVLVLLAGCGSRKMPATEESAGAGHSVAVESAGKEDESATREDDTTEQQTAETEGAAVGTENKNAERENSVPENNGTGKNDGTVVPETTVGVGTKADWETVSQETLAEPEPPTISLLMVGDILLHTPVEEAAKQEDGSYNFDAIFANVQEEIQAADLAIVNQEVILGGEDLGISGYPAFNAPFAVGDALIDAGFDVVCHGTNHALDKGKKGLLNCINFWREEYPQAAVLGIHDSQESQDEIFVYEQDGIKVPF